MSYFVGLVFAAVALYLIFDIRNNLRQLQRRLDAVDPLLVNLEGQIADAALEAAETRKLSEQVLNHVKAQHGL